MANNLVAQLLRDISKDLKNREFAAKLYDVGRQLVSDSSQGMVAGYEEGDDLCPPYIILLHFPPPPPPPDPWEKFILNTSWSEELPGSMNEVTLALGIRTLASLTTSEKASSAMKQIGESIVKQAAGQVFDDYCATRVKPLVPPKPKTVAA